MELEIILKNHPEFEKFINVRVEQAQLNRELEQLETTMKDLDSEMFRMSDEQEIEQAKAKRIVFRDRRQFLRVAVTEQQGKVRIITRDYLKGMTIILRSRPTSEYLKFINVCLESLDDHESIGEIDRREFLEDVLQVFGKE